MELLDEPVRLASVGVGEWGRVLAQGALATGRCAIVACTSPTAARRAQFAAEFGGRALENYVEVLCAPDVEAVLLATPNETHREYIELAAAAGKHVLVEKPITLTLEEAFDAAWVCKRTGVILAVGHQSRREAGIRKMRTLIDGGEIGTIIAGEANLSTGTGLTQTASAWRRDNRQVPGGPLIQIAIHQIDSLAYLLGPIRYVSGVQRRRILADIDDATATWFECESGALVSLVSAYCTTYAADIRIQGTTGSLHYDRLGGLELRRDQPNRRARQSIEIETNDPIREQMEEFARCIRHGGRPETGAREAAAALAVVLAALESQRSGHRVDVRDFFQEETFPK